MLRHRIGDVAGLPEGLEIRPLDAVARGLLPDDLVEMAQPLHLAAAFGEVVAEAEPPGEIGEDVEIVARLADRLDRLMHREHVAVGRRGDVVALERRGRRQHDVGVARGRRPEDLVHDDGFGTLPGLHQPVDVLMMVERIAAAPVDQLDLGEGDALAVVVDGLARMQQQVGDARDRDVGIDRAAPDRTVERRHRRARPAPSGSSSRSRSRSRRRAARSGRASRRARRSSRSAARRGRRAAATRWW